jgi:hypothetical protein
MIKYFKLFSDFINSYREDGYDFDYEVNKRLITLKDKKIKVLEIGCNYRPLIKKEKHKNIILHGIDPDNSISPEKTKDKFDKFTTSSIENFETNVKYDIIVIDMVLEHLKNNKVVFKKLSDLINDDGMILTNQPSNLHPFSILNRILNHKTKNLVLRILRPWSEVGVITGWKSYYHYCNYYGFKQLSNNNNLIIKKGKFNYNASDYFAFFPPLFILIVIYEVLIKFFNFKLLCSNFFIEIRKKV